MSDDLSAKPVHNLALRVFQRYFGELCQALSSDPHQMAREMFSKELISKETMSNVVETRGIPPLDKAGILMGVMANKIAAEKSSKPLVSFCRLLERSPVAGSIASRMKARLVYVERHDQLPGDEFDSEAASETRPSSSRSPSTVIEVVIGDDVVDKMCALKVKFTATIEKYAYSYSVLFKGEVEKVQYVVRSMLDDETYKRISCFRQIFFNMEEKEQIDVFYTRPLKMLSTRGSPICNNIAELFITYYDVQKDKFLQSVKLEDYVNAIQGAPARQVPKGFAAVEMKFIGSSENWPKKPLKEFSKLLNHVYGKFSKLPTHPEITHGVVVMKWCTPKSTKKEVERRTEEYRQFLISKGCEVTVAEEKMVEYSLARDIKKAADHVRELKSQVEKWIEAACKLLRVLEVVAKGLAMIRHENEGFVLFRHPFSSWLPYWLQKSPHHCRVCGEEVKKEIQHARELLPNVLRLAETVNECFITSRLSLSLNFLTYMFSGKFCCEQSLSIVLDACKLTYLEDIEQLITQRTRCTPVPDLGSYIINLKTITINDVGDVDEVVIVAQQSNVHAATLRYYVDHLKTLPFVCKLHMVNW